MTGLEWVFSFSLLVIYITALFTVALYTLRKGHTILFIIGIFLPILWLIGAIIPAKQGSRYDIEQEQRYQSQMTEYTR